MKSAHENRRICRSDTRLFTVFNQIAMEMIMNGTRNDHNNNKINNIDDALPLNHRVVLPMNSFDIVVKILQIS